MRDLSRTATKFFPAVVLLLGSAFVWQTRNQSPMPLGAPLPKLLPVIAGFKSVDQTVDDESRRVAGMTDYSARAYTRDSIVDFALRLRVGEDARSLLRRGPVEAGHRIMAGPPPGGAGRRDAGGAR